MDAFHDDLWVETELLPLYVGEPAGESIEEWSTPPVREAFRVLAPPLSAWTDRPAPVLVRGHLWVDAVPSRRRPASERSVRRILDLPFAVALAALRTAVLAGTALVVDPTHARAREGEYRLPGALHVHRCWPPAQVDVVLEPWSPTRTELHVDARCHRRGAPLSSHYFDVAHEAADALRSTLVTSAAALVRAD